jgi:hypothetical protein
MGLMKKAANFTVVKITGLADTPAKEIITALEGAKIKEIKGTGDAEAFGFCKIDDPFERGTSVSDGMLGFGLRHDKKKVSKTLFKRLYKEELRKQKGGLIGFGKKKKMTKEEKQFVKDEVLSKLYAEASPLEKLNEVILNYKEGVAFIGTTTPQVVDGFSACIRKLFPDVEISVWQPEVIDNETKGTKENYQNALMTWILHKSVSEPKRQWVPQSAKFFDGVSTITVKSEHEFPTEAWLSSYKDRVVDALSFSITKDDKQIDISLSRGSWSLKQVKCKPDVVHEDADSALFERYHLFNGVVSEISEIVTEFGKIRGTDDEESFWQEVHTSSMERIKQEVK